MIEKYDATLYKSENFAILKYCYEIYSSNGYIKPYIGDFSAIQEETNILQESMEEEIDETLSSMMKTMMMRAKRKRRKNGIATHAHLLMRVALQLIYCLISLHAYRRMNAMTIAMISLILLKYTFLMMLAMLVAKMPI